MQLSNDRLTTRPANHLPELEQADRIRQLGRGVLPTYSRTGPGRMECPGSLGCFSATQRRESRLSQPFAAMKIARPKPVR
jgi:hypothetical protein